MAAGVTRAESEDNKTPIKYYSMNAKNQFCASIIPVADRDAKNDEGNLMFRLKNNNDFVVRAPFLTSLVKETSNFAMKTEKVSGTPIYNSSLKKDMKTTVSIFYISLEDFLTKIKSTVPENEHPKFIVFESK